MARSNKIVTAIIVILFISTCILFPVNWNHPSNNDPVSLLEEAKRLSLLQNWYAAAPLFERAEVLFSAANDSRNQTYARIGRIRARAEEMSQLEASRLLARELESPALASDKKMRLWCLMAKGAIDFMVDSGVAKRDYVEALAIAKSLGDGLWAARAMGEIGVIEFLEGDTTVGESDVSKAIEAAYIHGDIGAQIEFFAVAGIAFNEVKRFDEALPLLRRTIELAEQTQGAGFPYLAYQGLGAALIARGQREEAWRALYKAISTAHDEHQHGQEAFLSVSLGDACTARGDVEGAKRYFEQAGELFKSIRFERGLDEATLKLANIDRAQGKLQEAEHALSIGMKSGPGMDAFYRPRALTALAELRVEQGRLLEANALFEAAEDVREATVIKLHSPLEIAAMAGSMSETYLEHFRLAVRQRDIPRAFGILERVRGRTAAGLLYSHNSEPTESPREAALSAQINAVQRTLMETDDAQERTTLLRTLYQLEREVAVADNESTISRTELTPTNITVSSIQRVLREDELMLEYVLAEPHGFCIAISRDRAEIVSLPAGSKRIQDLVDSYLEEIKAKKSGSQAADLYGILLEPILNNFAQSRLLISPDGVLALLPFESLRDAKAVLLVRSKTVSYVPSASKFQLLRTDGSTEPAPRPLLAVGDVNYTNVRLRRSTGTGSVTAAIMRGLEGLFRAQLEPLPASRDEVISIAHTFPSNSSILLGKDATETGFKAQPLADYRVIHLAVHAISDPQYPYRASLVLGSDSKDDGLLQVREIMRLPRLHADLVSLSGCETGVGTLQGEAGMASLVQAFLTIGAKAVVGSLWKVEDRWTSELMKDFYKHLAYEDEATALAHAKLDLLDRYGDSAPYNWAGFTLWGEGSRASH
jgi:CHAT domain-containing protein/tetratricopeptide (TPR) repeat protein